MPIAKAYSGLTDEEIRRVGAFVRHNMIEKFGPARTVEPELVVELAFEGLNRSNRHKSGVAVRFPRILRWRTDKTAAEADTLDTIRALFTSRTRRIELISLLHVHEPVNSGVDNPSITEITMSCVNFA